jgi:hypothetical protein
MARHTDDGGTTDVSGRSATEVRSLLDHPVIDIDGHTVEFFPALAGELVREGVRLDGESLLRRTSGTFGPIVDWYALTPEERGASGTPGGAWPLGQRRHGARDRPGHRDAAAPVA